MPLLRWAELECWDLVFVLFCFVFCLFFLIGLLIKAELLLFICRPGPTWTLLSVMELLLDAWCLSLSFILCLCLNQLHYMWKSGPKPTLEDWWKVCIDLSLDANTNPKKALTTFLGNWPKRDELISMPYATALPLSNLFLRLFFPLLCWPSMAYSMGRSPRFFFFSFKGRWAPRAGPTIQPGVLAILPSHQIYLA